MKYIDFLLSEALFRHPGRSQNGWTESQNIYSSLINAGSESCEKGNTIKVMSG